jgi:hypothetical protein
MATNTNIGRDADLAKAAPALLKALQELTGAVSGTTSALATVLPIAAEDVKEAQDKAMALLARLFDDGVF